MQEVIDILLPFYTDHINFGLVAGFMILLALLFATKKNFKAMLILLCMCFVYNLVLFNKTKRNPEWYNETMSDVKAYDPIKKLWDERPADDDVNKRK